MAENDYIGIELDELRNGQDETETINRSRGSSADHAERFRQLQERYEKSVRDDDERLRAQRQLVSKPVVPKSG